MKISYPFFVLNLHTAYFYRQIGTHVISQDVARSRDGIKQTTVPLAPSFKLKYCCKTRAVIYTRFCGFWPQ